VATHSTKATVGSQAPRFSLPDADGASIALDDLLTNGPVVIAFLRGFA
jgi:peroxiredoxin